MLAIIAGLFFPVLENAAISGLTVGRFWSETVILSKKMSDFRSEFEFSLIIAIKIVLIVHKRVEPSLLTGNQYSLNTRSTFPSIPKLSKNLNSSFSQRMQDWEIVIINDILSS